MSNILYLEPEKGEEIGSRIYIIFLSERERERVEKRHVRKGGGDVVRRFNNRLPSHVFRSFHHRLHCFQSEPNQTKASQEQKKLL
jgi:hypothetical protein